MDICYLHPNIHTLKVLPQVNKEVSRNIKNAYFVEKYLATV